MADPTPAQFWLTEIASYEARQKRARWEMWARKSVGEYSLTTGDNREVDTVEGDGAKKRYNIFWSNVENLKPGMYSRTPKVVVSRRHTGSRDKVAKIAAEVLENVISYQLSEHGFGSAIRAARDDYLLVGRGVPWARYVPAFGAANSESVGEGSENPAASTMITSEETVLDYVHWSDFGHTDARRWEDVRACWRRHRMTKEMVKRYFGEEWAVKVPYDSASIRSDVTDTSDKPEDDANAMATIYEVWDAHKRAVLFVCKGIKEALKTEDTDPLKLPRFFPCPRPIMATLSNDDLFPVSDYRQYRTQIKQIQQLTMRIDSLTDAVRLVGVYDAQEKEIPKIFEKADGGLVPVTNWASLAGKGGLDGCISFIPMKEIAETLTLLHNERDKALNDSYQLTGISDLIRGDTQASETATAQNIKNNYITMRFDEKKREIDRAVVNVLNIYGAMVCHVFQDASIMQMSGIQLFHTRAELAQCQQAIAMASQPAPQPNPQAQPGQQPPPPPQAPMPPAQQVEMCDRPSWEEVLPFLRNDALRSVAIDIETDSTVVADQQQQQQSASTFLQMLGGFLKEATQAGQQTPQLVPLIGQMLSWGVRQFPIGRDLEEAVDTAVDKLETAARDAEKNPPPTPPDPEMVKMQGMMELQKAKQQGEMELAQAKMQGDMALKAKDMGHSHASDHAGMVLGAAQDAHGTAMDAHGEMLKAHVNAALQAQAEQFKQQTAALVAHIQNLGKIEVARITADASADADAEAHETQAGA